MDKQQKQDNLGNEQEKLPYVKSSGTDDADTSDERSKILLAFDAKKDDDRHQSGQHDQEVSSEESDAKMFTKVPSYFLDVQENSIIVEEQFQYSIKDSKSNRPKVQPQKPPKNHQKLLKKISNSSKHDQHEHNKSELAYSSQIYIIDSQQLSQNHGYIWDRFVCLGSLKICVNQITKLKCLLDFVSPSQRKLKIVQNQNQVLYFAASTSLSGSSLNPFSEHYLWFCKLINKKIQSISYLLKPLADKQSIEVTPPNLATSKSLIKGIIYKKSQHLLNWQARYIIIMQNELQSYKNIEKPPTFCIRAESCKYIWTRFDLYNGHLIIKLKHGIAKTEFAIPIVDFSQEKPNNWLSAFYKLLIYNKEY